MNNSKNSRHETTHVGETIRGVAHGASEKIEHFGHKVEQLGKKAADKSDNLIHKGNHVIGKYGDSVAEYIKENPLKAALIAGAFGILLGKFLSK